MDESLPADIHRLTNDKIHGIKNQKCPIKILLFLVLVMIVVNTPGTLILLPFCAIRIYC